MIRNIYAYHSVFDGDPFPAPMSVTGVMGPYDMMMGASKVLFLNTMAMHFNAAEGTFVDVSELSGSGQVIKGNTITASNAGYIVVVLAKVAQEFAGMPMGTMANDALTAQVNFILTSLKHPDGGFYNSYTIGNGPSNAPQNLESQAAIIRGLYEAYLLTNNATLLQEANDAYNYLINTFYVPSLNVFKTEKNNNTATYTPFNLAVLSGALREASLVGNQADAATIYTRVFKSVYNKMILTEAEQSGETGNDSDGDGVPYIAGGKLPFTFAAEGTYDITITGINPFLAANTSISVYPNPATDFINIQFSLTEASKVDVKIFDLNGRLMLAQPSQSKISGTQNLKVSLASLPPNTYFVRLTVNNEIAGINKLVVIR